jgi:hypothetical protein
MKTNEVPQDDANMFEGKMRELQYAVDENGKYTTVKSVGWEIKNLVMEQAWDVEKEKIQNALNLVENGEKSPIYYYLYKCLMDVKILSMYTGFSRFKVKRHFKPKYFSKLTNEQLDKYVYAFALKERSQLTNFSANED